MVFRNQNKSCKGARRRRIFQVLEGRELLEPGRASEQRALKIHCDWKKWQAGCSAGPLGRGLVPRARASVCLPRTGRWAHSQVWKEHPRTLCDAFIQLFRHFLSSKQRARGLSCQLRSCVTPSMVSSHLPTPIHSCLHVSTLQQNDETK